MVSISSGTIRRYVTNIANHNSTPKVLTAIGAVSLAMLLYDSAKNSITKGLYKADHDLGKDLYNRWLIGGFGGETLGRFTTPLKKTFNNSYINSPIVKTFIQAKDLSCSLLNEIVKNTVPLALSIGAILAPSNNLPGKLTKAFCAGTLLLGGVKLTLCDIFGLGKDKLTR